MSFKLDMVALHEALCPLAALEGSLADEREAVEETAADVLAELATQLRPHIAGAREDEGLEALLGRLLANQRGAQPAPPADLVVRLAKIARDARGASQVQPDPARFSFEEWALLIEQDGIRAVLAALAEMGDVEVRALMPPDSELDRLWSVYHDNSGGETGVEAVLSEFMRAHLTPVLAAQRAEIARLKAEAAVQRREGAAPTYEALQRELEEARAELAKLREERASLNPLPQRTSPDAETLPSGSALAAPPVLSEGFDGQPEAMREMLRVALRDPRCACGSPLICSDPLPSCRRGGG